MRDRALGGFALLVALAVVVLVLRPLWSPHRTVVHERPVVTTPIVSSPLTPLRDSGPKNNPRSTDKAAAKNGLSVPSQLTTTTAPQNRSLPVKKRQAPKTTPTPRPSSQGSPQPSQPSPTPSPQPSPPPPVVGVTVPALPGSVCLRPAATVNCP